MKFKRIIGCVLLCTLVLSLLASAACAESLFPQLQPAEPTPSPAPQSTVAPSYGDFAGVAVDEEQQNQDGGTIVTYKNVSVQQMEDFGKELKAQGYENLQQEQQGNQYAYQVSNDIFTFTIFYDTAEQVLKIVYPEGMVYAESLFPGYTKVYLGETFNIKDMGEFTFDSAQLGIRIKTAYDKKYSWRTDSYYKVYFDCSGLAVSFQYYNTSTSSKAFHSTDYSSYDAKGYSVNSDLFIPELTYKNIDNIYTYELYCAGSLQLESDSGDAMYLDGRYSEAAKSLETTVLVCGFELPTGVSASTDGTLAMKMDFPNGEKYVLMLRENGVNLY